MKKPIIIAILAVLVLLGVIGGILYFATGQIQNETGATPTIVTPVPEDVASEVLAEYRDVSGFSFQYPNDFSVNNKKTDDDSIYSDVLISSKKNDNGSISIRVEDTKLKNFEAWLIKEAIATASAKISESTLSGITSHIVEGKDKVYMVAIDKGILFTITLLTNKDKKYFQSAFDTIVSTFQFGQQDTSATASSDDAGSGSDIVVEEEVIE